MTFRDSGVPANERDHVLNLVNIIHNSHEPVAGDVTNMNAHDGTGVVYLYMRAFAHDMLESVRACAAKTPSFIPFGKRSGEYAALTAQHAQL